MDNGGDGGSDGEEQASDRVSKLRSLKVTSKFLLMLCCALLERCMECRKGEDVLFRVLSCLCRSEVFFSSPKRDDLHEKNQARFLC